MVSERPPIIEYVSSDMLTRVGTVSPHDSARSVSNINEKFACRFLDDQFDDDPFAANVETGLEDAFDIDIDIDIDIVV